MENNNYTVYKHTAPNGKIYIGITGQNIKKRWSNGTNYKNNEHFCNAIKKYGWNNFSHEILFEKLTKEEACEKEVELIALYDATNPEKGYNLQSGGSAFNHNSSTIKKMSEVAKKTNRKPTEEAIAHSVEVNRKSVKCIETGEVFNSVIEAALSINKKDTSHICEVCKGKRKTAYGFHWEYAN